MVALAEKINSVITTTVQSIGFRSIRIRVIDAPSQTIQVMAEPLDGSLMTVDHCATISDTVSPILDIEVPAAEKYSLEVSSPGIDRPLVSREDFQAWTSHEVKLSTRRPLNGRQKFRGTLHDFNATEDTVILVLPDAKNKPQVAIPFSEIDNTKLILTDSLIEHYKQKYKTLSVSAEGDSEVKL